DAADAAPPVGGARTRRAVGAGFVERRMKAARFDYVRPADVGEALAALAKADGGAKLLAGGQSLGPMLNLRLAPPSLLVDGSALASLQQFKNISRALRIGARGAPPPLGGMRGPLPPRAMLCGGGAAHAHPPARHRPT